MLSSVVSYACLETCNITFVMFFSDWDAVVKLSDDFNGADLRNVCTEAGLFFSLFNI